MSTNLLFTRRKIVFASISAFATALLPISGLAFILPESRYNAVKKRLLSIFNHKESMEFIGRKYIEQMPIEQKESTLIESILYGNSNAIFEHSILSNKKEIKSFIQSRVKEDFSNKQIVSIQGWVLSKTEARLCALVYLDAGSEQ